jgi:glucose-1-phosphate cytidylyltransferase
MKTGLSTKVVILAGGRGLRLVEETKNRPKPMVQIGGKPLLWHIMKGYAHYGFSDFIVCTSYMHEVIEKEMPPLARSEGWNLEMVYTEDGFGTGGRIRAVRDKLGDEPFFATYGDALGNIDFAKELEFHASQKKIGTITAVRPRISFGVLEISKDSTVLSFAEKPENTSLWSNGGFFIFEPRIFDYIERDEEMLEREPLERLIRDNELAAYRHQDFRRGIDTYKDLVEMRELWDSGKAPWKTWSAD